MKTSLKVALIFLFFVAGCSKPVYRVAECLGQVENAEAKLTYYGVNDTVIKSVHNLSFALDPTTADNFLKYLNQTAGELNTIKGLKASAFKDNQAINFIYEIDYLVISRSDLLALKLIDGDECPECRALGFNQTLIWREQNQQFSCSFETIEPAGNQTK